MPKRTTEQNSLTVGMGARGASQRSTGPPERARTSLVTASTNDVPRPGMPTDTTGPLNWRLRAREDPLRSVVSAKLGRAVDRHAVEREVGHEERVRRHHRRLRATLHRLSLTVCAADDVRRPSKMNAPRCVCGAMEKAGRTITAELGVGPNAAMRAHQLRRRGLLLGWWS